ncbi:MAG TPA: PqqD family protein [Candidatus Dormibacteraeota bacterium]|nr:PqqD family protein [Candidatus Dormibacteraeota bacterium]
MSAPTGNGPVPTSKNALSNFRKSGNVVSRVVANEAIVVPIRRGAADLDSIFTFNEAGTALWAIVEANGSSWQMSEFLEREYGLSATQAAADTQVFIENLAAAGLIETV